MRSSTYYIAHGLIGLPSSTLRVRETEILSDGSVAVMTADLRDVGTPLVLDADQLTPEAPEETTVGIRHRSGFVVMEGA